MGFNTKDQTPGLGNVPVLGNLFKGKTKSDSMDELLIFIAPRFCKMLKISRERKLI